MCISKVATAQKVAVLWVTSPQSTGPYRGLVFVYRRGIKPSMHRFCQRFDQQRRLRKLLQAIRTFALESGIAQVTTLACHCARIHVCINFVLPLTCCFQSGSGKRLRRSCQTLKKHQRSAFHVKGCSSQNGRCLWLHDSTLQLNCRMISTFVTQEPVLTESVKACIWQFKNDVSTRHDQDQKNNRS